MICNKTPIIIDYIYSNTNKDSIEYIHSHFTYKYLCILNNPQWINIVLLNSKLQEMSNNNRYYGDESNTLYSHELIQDFVHTETLDINTYMSFNRYVNKEIPDKSWNAIINLTAKPDNKPYANNIFIATEDSNIYSMYNSNDIRLDYAKYSTLLETNIHHNYNFNHIVYIYPNTHINLHTLYNIIDYININNINYYKIDNFFYITSYEYIIKNKELFIKQNTYIHNCKHQSKQHILTLFDFYNNINIYDYHDEEFIYNTYNVRKSENIQDIVAINNISMSLTKPFYKYICVIYTSNTTLSRMNILRDYWLKLENFSKYKLIIVSGGHKRTYLEKENKFGFDIDILYTEDDDSYIRFPYIIVLSIYLTISSFII